MRLLLFTFLLSALSFGQDRNGISYQALIINPNVEQLPGQDNHHAPLTNTDICLQFHIINSSGVYEYSESQSVTTDAYGMVNLVIGTGTPIGAIPWDDVAWSAEAKSLKVDLDITGACTSFTELSNQQLTSVPFALYSPASNTPGPKGDPGDPGEDGDSAYQVWLDEGNTGTEQDFLDSLKGTDGTPGDPGADGDSAYQVWLDAGNTGTEQEFLDSLKGADGDPGEGTEGKSAYDIWIELGNTGTEQDFIDSLVGAQGEPGQDGNSISSQTCMDFELVASYITNFPRENAGPITHEDDNILEFYYPGATNGNANQFFVDTNIEIQDLNSNKVIITSANSNLMPWFDIKIRAYDTNNQLINLSVKKEQMWWYDSDYSDQRGRAGGGTYNLNETGNQPNQVFFYTNGFEYSDVLGSRFVDSGGSTGAGEWHLNLEITSSTLINKLVIEYPNTFFPPNGAQTTTAIIKYTCSNPQQDTNNETPPSTLQVGDEWGGGIVFYIAQPGDPIYVEGEIHGLIAPKNFVAGGGPSNPNTAWEYSPYKEMYEQIQNSSLYQIGDGLETTNLINQTYLLNRPSELDNDLNAWVFASKSNLNGYNDWYIPNGIELGKLLIYAGVTNCSNSIDGDNIIGRNMVQGMYINSGTYYNSIGKVVIGCIQVSDCSGQCYNSKFYMIRRF